MIDKKELTEIMKLMKRMGSTRGFDPIPPDQHSWAMREGNPPWLRVWGWMCAHTFHWGHRCEFAVDNEHDRRELHLEHMAEDLGMNDGNVRKAWKECLRRKLVRPGTYAEGERRLYLCGEVEAITEEGEENENEYVCTDGFPPHIWLKIKDRPSEEIEILVRERKVLVDARKASLADLVAAQRLICDQLDDTQFRGWGLEPRRDGPKPKGTPEEIAERQRRQAAIAPAVETLVHTVLASVQAKSEEAYTAQKDLVQGDPSLLELETTERGRRESGAGKDSVPVGPPVPLETVPKMGRSSYPRANPTSAPAREAESEAQAPETDEAIGLLAEQIRFMQRNYPNTGFGTDELDPTSKAGRLYLLRLLTAIGGPSFVLPYALYVGARFKGIKPHALGKAVGRAPNRDGGPRGIGLLLNWADDFSRESGRAKVRGGANAKGASS